MNANAVTIKASKTGALVNVYKSNPNYGYIQLTSSERTIEGTWVRVKSRSTLLKAEVAVLEDYVKDLQRKRKNADEALTLPGRIVVQEFVESELPASFKSRFSKSLPYEDAIASFVKRTGINGIELTVGGERILRFTDYDASGTIQDRIVAHDNVEAVAAHRAATQTAEAEF